MNDVEEEIDAMRLVYRALCALELEAVWRVLAHIESMARDGVIGAVQSENRTNGGAGQAVHNG